MEESKEWREGFSAYFEGRHKQQIENPYTTENEARQWGDGWQAGFECDHC